MSGFRFSQNGIVPVSTEIKNPVTVSDVQNPITVSSVTNSVTVLEIKDPVTVSSITTPVTVSSVTNPVTVSSITSPVTVLEIKDPITTLTSETRLDAFGRKRVSNPEVVFDSKQIVDNQPLYWDDQQTSGSGTSSTYNTNQSSTTISVSNLTAGVRIRQTFRRFNYQPGRGQTIFMTGVLGNTSSGITTEIGYFDDKNGLFFRSQNGTTSIVVRTYTSGAAVETAIAQASWNLDTLAALDMTKTQIFVIDFQWLGVGRVRFGFNIDGVLTWVHQVLNANHLTTVFMSTPNLPLRYRIANDGTGPASSLIHICTAIISEGGNTFLGLSRVVSRNLNPLTTSNSGVAYYPLLAIRLKSTYQHATVTPFSFSIVCTSNSTFHWILVMNPTIVGTALSFVSLINSPIEFDNTTTNATTMTGGTIISSGYSNQGAASSPELNVNTVGDLKLGASIAGVSDVLALGISRFGSQAETYYASLNFREQF